MRGRTGRAARLRRRRRGGRRPGQLAGLSPREIEVAGLVARGLSNRAIADRMVLSHRTVEGHVERILAKRGFHNRVEIAAWVFGGHGSDVIVR